jgi:succinate dehydrogenase hydrophobic anchor subunit
MVRTAVRQVVKEYMPDNVVTAIIIIIIIIIIIFFFFFTVPAQAGQWATRVGYHCMLIDHAPLLHHSSKHTSTLGCAPTS